MEAEEADQLRAMEIQSIKGGLGGRTEEHGFGRCLARPNNYTLLVISRQN